MPSYALNVLASDNAAAWAQAIASVGAIFAAIHVPKSIAKSDRAIQKEYRDTIELRSVALILPHYEALAIAIKAVVEKISATQSENMMVAHGARIANIDMIKSILEDKPDLPPKIGNGLSLLTILCDKYNNIYASKPSSYVKNSEDLGDFSYREWQSNAQNAASLCMNVVRDLSPEMERVTSNVKLKTEIH